MTVRRSSRRRFAVLFAWLLLPLGAVTVASSPAYADPGDVGFQGASFSGTGTGVTGAKPESKLWYHDNTWWAVMWDTTTGDNYVFRLDPSTETWVRTNTFVDPRGGTRSDVLVVGDRVYVASHGFTNTASAGFPARLYRLSYDPVAREWRRDSGFPVNINNYKTETLVIDRDATGTLWATWVQDATVHVARTQGSDMVWGPSFAVPTPEASGLTPDDISSLVAFNGDIGVMWSNQNTGTFSFAVHAAGAPDGEWTVSSAMSGPGMADDHINLKAAPDGRVFAVVKTNRTAPTDPLVLLLVRDPSTGDWAQHVFGTVHDSHTRPIAVLDIAAGTVHVFATAGQAGGVIYTKASSMDAISFAPGRGVPFMLDADSNDLNDATSAKQPLDATTGLVVMASNDTIRRYWHNRTSLGTPPLTAAFGASPTEGLAPLMVQFVDQSTGGASTWLWSFGDGGSSDVQHPTHLYAGAGVFSVTLTVTGGIGSSSTVTRQDHISVVPPPSSVTFVPAGDSYTSRTKPNSNFGTLTALQVKNGGTGSSSPHYHTYVRFDVDALPGTVTAARLRLYVADGSRDGGTVYPTSAGWDETTLTWNTEAGPTGPAYGGIGPVVDQTFVEVPLPPELFAAPGPVAFLIQSDVVGAGTTIYDSREGANQPTLVLEG